MRSTLSPLPNQDSSALPAAAKDYGFPPLQIADPYEPVAPVTMVTRPIMPSLPSLMGSPPFIGLSQQPNWGTDLPSLPALRPAVSIPYTIDAPSSAFDDYMQPFAGDHAFVVPTPESVIPQAATPSQLDTPASALPSFTPYVPPAAAFEEATSVPENSPFVIHTPTAAHAVPPRRKLPPLESEPTRLDYTDHELLDVFRPLIGDSMQRSLFQPGGGMDTYLEPMLRATIRRALAEHSPTQSPFLEPGFFDRIGWRLQALLTSRTYEEVHFEKTRRFRVEEVYLLEKVNLAMISYASSDPARHASAKRVQTTARRIADGALDKEGTIRLFYDLPEGRHAVVREGKNAFLIAVVLGTPSDGLRIDLDYTLHRVEERFGSRFHDLEDPLMLSIQPHLEDCLLIIAPSSNI